MMRWRIRLGRAELESGEREPVGAVPSGVREFLAEGEIRHAVNAGAPIFEVSCKTGLGLENWVQWLAGQIEAFRNR